MRLRYMAQIGLLMMAQASRLYTCNGSSGRTFETLNFLLKRKAQSLTINLGTEKVQRLRVIKTFSESQWFKNPYRFVDRRPGDTLMLLQIIHLAKSILNWDRREILLIFAKMGGIGS